MLQVRGQRWASELLPLVDSVNVFNNGCQSLSTSLADVTETVDERQQLTTGVLLTHSYSSNYDDDYDDHIDDDDNYNNLMSNLSNYTIKVHTTPMSRNTCIPVVTITHTQYSYSCQCECSLTVIINTPCCSVVSAKTSISKDSSRVCWAGFHFPTPNQQQESTECYYHLFTSSSSSSLFGMHHVSA